MSRPWVSANMAISLDGKISTRAYTPALFTSELDFNRLLELRSKADALLVGRGTLEADNMTLTVPESVLNGTEGPLRCVISQSGQWDSEHALYAKPGPEIVLAHTSENYQPIEGVEHLKVEDVMDFLVKLAERGIEHVHSEGGGVLLKSLFAANAVDELHLTWAAHTLFGGGTAPSISGVVGDYLTKSCQFELVHFEPNEAGECFLSYQRVGAIKQSEV